MLRIGILVVTLVLTIASAAAAPLPLDQWRARRLANLTSETGWLTLVGLYWLREGENTFGRAATNRLALDHESMSDTTGVFTMKSDAITFTAKPGVTVTHEDQPITTISMTPDTMGNATVLATGTLRFHVIERAGRFGVRVRDVAHPARTHFKGLDYFPASNDWIVNARFEPYPKTRRIPIVNILGMTEQMVSPGAVVFTKNGKEWRLDAILETPDDDQLFLMFADATSGRETYGAGRFIYVPLPHDGRVTVDFNRAYNPPCAFNEFATCPLPPPQNRLAMRVDAGEKKYANDH